MSKQEASQQGLENAPPSVKLAVDLIQLLEENKITTEVAIEALEMVINDYKKKQRLTISY